MTQTPDDVLRDRCSSLFRFLHGLTSLRSTAVRSVDNYDQVLWFGDVPNEPECDSIATRERVAGDPDDEASDAAERDDVWLEIEKPSLRSVPEPSAALEPWLVAETLEDSSLDAPELRERVKIAVAAGERDATVEERELESEPSVRSSFDYYVKERWLPWALEDRRLRKVQRVYTTLFAMHQRQERLGEDYQVALGLGLLCWKSKEGDRIRRHLIAADASIEIDARNGRITVGPGVDGARPQLEQDMLDPTDQPPPDRVSQLESLVRDLGDAIWSPDDVADICTQWGNAVAADSRYAERMDPPKRVSEERKIAFAPALLLRHRSDRSVLRTFEEILEQLRGGGPIPFGIARYVTVVGEDGHDAEPEPTLDRDYLPLPSNAEQATVLDRLRTQQGVLVQGPPGTGKSHTIANLMCHLLATGKRVLVTSHTARALEVLRDKLPGGFADLCVDLLGAGRDAMHSLERSVTAITERQQNFDRERSEAEIERLDAELQAARQAEAAAHASLREVQEAGSFEHRVEFEGETYLGTLMRIAERLDRDAERLGWIDDPIESSCEFPLRDADIEELARVEPGPRPIDGSGADLAPPTHGEIEARFARETKLDGATTPEEFANADHDTCATIASELESLLTAWTACDEHAQPWAKDAARDVLADQDRAWRERLEATRAQVDAIGDSAREVDEMRIAGIADRDAESVAAEAEALRDHLATGKGLGFWVFRSAVVKRTRAIWETVTVDGRPCTDVPALERLLGAIDVDRRLQRLTTLWEGTGAAPGGSRAIRAGWYADLCEPLDDAMSLHDAVAKLRDAIAPVEGLRAPRWQDRDAVEALATSARAALDAAELRAVRDELEKFAARLDDGAHPVARDLAAALRERDEARYDRGLERLDELRRLHELLDRIRDVGAPRLAEQLADPTHHDRIGDLRAAWAHRRAHRFVDDRLDPAREHDLRVELEQRQAAQRDTLCRLAETRAWHNLLTELDEHERQHLIAWTKAIRRIGKGTGKYAAKHRRDARQHMEHCRHAIPAWILPIYRVAETIRPGVDAFDVVIIDEASQSGPEALFLLYLTKKVIVVGDDKQISPDHVGIARDDVEYLRQQHLGELPISDAFGLENSLFDLAEIRYGNRVRLREHFRCMPEIIRFSNDLCYPTEPLIPLKQFGAGRLTPVIDARFVEGGYRDGTGTKVFNPVEADAIVDCIEACHTDPRYDGKSFGVISLQGPHQAQLIEGKLIDRLGPDAILDRDLVCGDAYAFQGDERDVMFLSLVAAPHKEKRIGTLADERAQRRFNVAVSRAREQMFLFYSVTLNDLSTKCLRHALLEYCLDPRAKSTLPDGLDAEALRELAHTRDRGRLDPPAPFDSWFEVDVCNRIAARGFRVQPQVEVAGYHIDLVVVGDERRVAVECDGDAWHGVEQYDHDQARQRALERCGWTFFRVRGSAFYLDRDAALEELWELLDAHGIAVTPALAGSE